MSTPPVQGHAGLNPRLLDWGPSRWGSGHAPHCRCIAEQRSRRNRRRLRAQERSSSTGAETCP
eukprot:4600342-Pyramimonas_sp.AAC.1